MTLFCITYAIVWSVTCFFIGRTTIDKSCEVCERRKKIEERERKRLKLMEDIAWEFNLKTRLEKPSAVEHNMSFYKEPRKKK